MPVVAGATVGGRVRMSRRRDDAPLDRFDRVPDDLARVGAHRAPARRHRGLVTFAWAALATGILVGAGVLGLQGIEVGVTTPERPVSTGAAPTGPAPTVDPQAVVVVLNATSTVGLAASAAKTADSDGWRVESTANADVQNIATSVVYYSSASQLGAARGLAKSLGITKAPIRSDRFAVEGQNRLTVVLGSDFAAA